MANAPAVDEAGAARPVALAPRARLSPGFFGPLVSSPLQRPHIWIGLAWSDIVQSYRRTFFGPFWITLNLVIFATAMTLVFSAVFGVPSTDYAGYVVCGMITWLWVSALLSEVGNTFITYAPFLRNTPIDKAFFVWISACKQAITLAHQLIVYLGLVLIGFIKPTIYTLLALPAIAILFVMSIPVTAVAAILFARYRDLPRLITGSIVIVMMVTPIFWKEDMISGWRSAVVYLNPVHYIIDFVRHPLLGEPIDLLTLGVVLAITAFAWVFGAMFYNRYQKYVVFWI